jgi:CPA2 family monovalent cation:H+ antiporter-2
MSMNVTSDFLYPVVVAVSAVTCLYGKDGTPFAGFRKKITSKMAQKNRYSANTQSIKSVSTWQIV